MVDSKIILSLDRCNLYYSLSVLKEISQYLYGVKIKSLIIERPARVVQIFKEFDLKVMVDLKFSDIPSAMEELIQSVEFADIITVYGKDNIVQGLNIDYSKLALVSNLTSNDGLKLDEMRSALNKANELMLGYYVCSANDIPFLDKENSKCKFLTPGIRLRDDKIDDQSRIITPSRAISLGSDYLIIGRSILNSDNVEKTVRKIIDDIEFIQNN